MLIFSYLILLCATNFSFYSIKTIVVINLMFLLTILNSKLKVQNNLLMDILYKIE